MAATISVRSSSSSDKNNGSVPAFGSVRFRFDTLLLTGSAAGYTEKVPDVHIIPFSGIEHASIIEQAFRY